MARSSSLKRSKQRKTNGMSWGDSKEHHQSMINLSQISQTEPKSNLSKVNSMISIRKELKFIDGKVFIELPQVFQDTFIESIKERLGQYAEQIKKYTESEQAESGVESNKSESDEVASEAGDQMYISDKPKSIGPQDDVSKILTEEIPESPSSVILPTPHLEYHKDDKLRPIWSNISAQCCEVFRYSVPNERVMVVPTYKYRKPSITGVHHNEIELYGIVFKQEDKPNFAQTQIQLICKIIEDISTAIALTLDDIYPENIRDTLRFDLYPGRRVVYKLPQSRFYLRGWLLDCKNEIPEWTTYEIRSWELGRIDKLKLKDYHCVNIEDGSEIYPIAPYTDKIYPRQLAKQISWWPSNFESSLDRKFSIGYVVPESTPIHELKEMLKCVPTKVADVNLQMNSRCIQLDSACTIYHPDDMSQDWID